MYRWIGAAVYESIVIFLVVVYGYNSKNNAIGSESRVEYGMVAFTLAVLIVNFKVRFSSIIDVYGYFLYDSTP
jgi:hypothetical protein